ncbi:MAG: chromate resistance protein [Burkholderiales bacterium]
MDLTTVVSPEELCRLLADFPGVTLVDVRRAEAFAADPYVIPGALRRAPEAVADWATEVEPMRNVVVYCKAGHDVGSGVAAALRTRGLSARHLAGGIAAWRGAGGRVVPYAAPSRWVTRARPKIDRIACPWLVRRFIDPAAEFHYVPADEVRSFAAAHGATAYDVPGVPYGHAGDRCSFDAFIRLHGLADPALADLATVVRAADTGAAALSPLAPGLLATSAGLSALFADDHAMLRAGMVVYDALYLWCRANRAAPAEGART